MRFRVRNLRRKILLLLSVAGLQAGLAAGPWRSEGPAADDAGATPVSALAVADSPAAVDDPLAAGTPAVPEQPAAPAPVAEPAPVEPASPAAALVPAERLYLEPILTQAAVEYSVPVDMLLAQAWAESSWRMEATSN